MAESVTRFCNATELPQASYDFDYDAVEAALSESRSPQPDVDEVALEFLIRGLLLVRKDTRPQLCIDCIIKGLKHPFYARHSLEQVAQWNNVTKPAVYSRVEQIQVKLGITDDLTDLLLPGGSFFFASSKLVGALLYVGEHDEPKTTIDCLILSTGHPCYEGISQLNVARKFGITKAGIHKQITLVKKTLNLGRSRYNKAPEASEQYARFNKNPKHVGDGANGTPLEA